MMIYLKRVKYNIYSDAQGAVLTVHSQTKTATLHINLCGCSGKMIKYSHKSRIKTVAQLSVDSNIN